MTSTYALIGAAFAIGLAVADHRQRGFSMLFASDPANRARRQGASRIALGALLIHCGLTHWGMLLSGWRTRKGPA